ncbi:carcinoembryonic antigen-related cell adhesion molecule 5-like [Ictalurus furcatus]|uniref:carcinoembryonic antigen-related cell adhesion molecule 5-like n=1 Tax=Ictalurus furcatus TaxID=66913 RepID=UPI0023500D4E|nr:carcinoembryonic antigen-related cell adhesion molecule 5-like [Ictalurus furcatus]
MDAARERRTRRSTPIIPVLDSMQFSQWTFMDLPDRYDGFFGYLDYFLTDCQSYFSSLFDPKPRERQWIKFMMSRFFGPARKWAQQVAAMRPRVQEDSRQFSDLFLREFGEPGQSYNLDELLKGVTVANIQPMPESAGPVAPVQPTPESADPVAPVQPTPESAGPVAPVQPTPKSADPVAPVLPKHESADLHSQFIHTFFYFIFFTESPKAVVTIKPDKHVFSGETVTLRCEIQGGGDTEWTYSWYKKDNTLYPSRTTQEFSFSSVRNDDSAEYTCRGRRSSDSQSSEISDAVTLTVSEKPKPTVRVNPQSSVYTGDRVTLTCNLKSTGWTFLWYRDYWQSIPLSPGTRNTNTLSVTVSNEGETQYYCKAHRGNYDSEISDPATITVRARPKPVVKVQPAERVFIGETVTLTCEIQTGESWRYLWYRNNEELSDAAGKKTHTITDIKDSDKGYYTCEGTKSSDPKYTQTSDAVTLTVSGECVLSHILFIPLTVKSVEVYFV